MAALAAVRSHIKVGSGVLNNWTRNIGLLASTFLTLDDLAPDRIICGIGAWWDPLAKNVGIERKKPLKAMRETIEVMKRLLNMERVTFHGEFHNVEGIELDVIHGRRESRNVPIFIGATQMSMALEYAHDAELVLQILSFKGGTFDSLIHAIEDMYQQEKISPRVYVKAKLLLRANEPPKPEKPSHEAQQHQADGSHNTASPG